MLTRRRVIGALGIATVVLSTATFAQQGTEADAKAMLQKPLPP
jgi:hypothetical protein